MFSLIEVLLIAVLGLALGSFFNVVIYRWSEGLSVLRPVRSFCPRCKTELKWYHNIPVLSYVLLKGRCGFCQNPIPLTYPLVEVLTAVVGVAAYLKFKPWYGWATFLVFWVWLIILLVISFIDLRVKEIPDKLSFGLMLAGLTASLLGLNPLVGFEESVVGMLAGAGLLFLINEVYYLFAKRDGLGMGDFKLMAGIGAFLGYKSFYWVVLIASFSGIFAFFLAVLWYRLKGKSKDLSLKTEIPFGPFLALGAGVYTFFAEFFKTFLS